jgi:hypothetical protein
MAQFDQPPQSTLQCLDLELQADGRTDSLRLSGCTFADVIHLCARTVWKKCTDSLEREFLTKPTIQAIKDQPIQAMELKLYEDGSVNHISLYGCHGRSKII